MHEGDVRGRPRYRGVGMDPRTTPDLSLRKWTKRLSFRMDPSEALFSFIVEYVCHVIHSIARTNVTWASGTSCARSRSVSSGAWTKNAPSSCNHPSFGRVRIRNDPYVCGIPGRSRPRCSQGHDRSNNGSLGTPHAFVPLPLLGRTAHPRGSPWTVDPPPGSIRRPSRPTVLEDRREGSSLCLPSLRGPSVFAVRERSLPAGGFEGGDWWMRFERVLPSRWRRKRHVQAKSAAVRRR